MKLSSILSTAVDAIITIDRRGIIDSFNPAAERMFGYVASEVVGSNVKILMPSPFKEEHDGYLSAYEETGERKIIGIGREVVGRRRDGSTFPMELSVGQTDDSDERLCSGVCRDLTQRDTRSRER